MFLFNKKVITSEKLKLNFPIADGDVFDDKNEEIFFSYSGKYSNTTNNLSDLSLSELESHVPTIMLNLTLFLNIRLKKLGVDMIYKEKVECIIQKH